MYVWSDQMGSRSRSAWLLLIDSSGHIHVFRGENIPEVCVVVGTDYEKAGKWSHTTYRLKLSPDVRPIAGRDGWNTGRFVEGLGDAVSYPSPVDRWVDLANAMKVTLGEAQRFLSSWRPRAAEALDQVEAALGEMSDDTDEEYATIAVSFGGPTRKLRQEGYWSWPVIVQLDRQEIGRLDRIDGDYVPSGRVKLLALEESPGHGGGYVSMRLAVPLGAVAEHTPD